MYNVDEGHISMTKIPTYNYNNDLVRYKYLERVDKTPEPIDQELQASANSFISRRNHSLKAEKVFFNL